MSDKTCTIRTRKFITNRLLQRKQFVSVGWASKLDALSLLSVCLPALCAAEREGNVCLLAHKHASTPAHWRLPTTHTTRRSLMCCTQEGPTSPR